LFKGSVVNIHRVSEIQFASAHLIASLSFKDRDIAI
jgi:hypothetical protein